MLGEVERGRQGGSDTHDGARLAGGGKPNRRTIDRGRHYSAHQENGSRFRKIPPMTWSIVARDADGALGVAVASRFFAVGALCPYARRGVGAVSTQALVNPSYGPATLD
ncbi:MAG TPA: DUF1028 domain-containing protein, partial [Casimicrobiaceae bacterium]|nr:DUF1028 domain-containing protein [Casimicrobiaceae bacterium]